MKKAILSFLLLVALLSATILVLPFGSPELPTTAGKLALDSTGKAYIATARPDGNWVFSLSANKVNAAWRLPASVNGFPAPVQQLSSNGTDLAVLQSWQDATTTHWRIWRKTTKDKHFTPVLDGLLEADTALPVLSFDRDALWLAFLQVGGSGARLSQVNEADASATLTEVAYMAATGGRFFTTATALGGRLYALMDDGVMLVDGIPLNYKEDAAIPCNLKTNAGALIAWSANGQNVLYTAGLTLAALPPLAETITVLDGTAADENTAVFLTTDGTSASLLRMGVSGYAGTERLQSSLLVRLQVRLPLLLLVLASLLVLYLIGFALYWLLTRCRFFALRVAGLCLVVFVFVVPVLAVLATAMLAGETQDIRLQHVETSAGRMVQEGATNTIGMAANTEGAALLLLEGTQGYLLSPAPGLPAGTPVESIFGKEIYKMATQAESRNAPVSKTVYNGLSPELYYLRPVLLPDNNSALLLMRVPSGAQVVQLRNFLSQALLLLGGGALLVLLLLSLIIWLICRPLQALRQSMEHVTAGVHISHQKYTSNDEVGALCRSLQEMSSALALQQYEYETAIRSYRRFVPDNLENFLGYETPVSTCTGDMALVKGPVALVSAENRTKVRRQLNDEHFVGFVNSCYSAVEQTASNHNGVLLGNAFNLSAFTLYFEESNNSALGFALALLDTQTVAVSKNCPAPSYFQLLHNATFLTGVTGSATRVINFISSQELDFLAEISDRFESINCRLVVTEQFLNGLETQVNTRYIGFVSSEDERYTYKLHEVLDVYSSMERSRRQQYAAKFQAAIRQFYRAEFHVARNAFSSILKICPTDGVARWYLYACEHYFNRQDSDNFNFGLLGTPLDLQG